MVFPSVYFKVFVQTSSILICTANLFSTADALQIAANKNYDTSAFRVHRSSDGSSSDDSDSNTVAAADEDGVQQRAKPTRCNNLFSVLGSQNNDLDCEQQNSIFGFGMSSENETEFEDDTIENDEEQFTTKTIKVYHPNEIPELAATQGNMQLLEFKIPLKDNGALSFEVFLYEYSELNPLLAGKYNTDFYIAGEEEPIRSTGTNKFVFDGISCPEDMVFALQRKTPEGIVEELKLILSEKLELAEKHLLSEEDKDLLFNLEGPNLFSQKDGEIKDDSRDSNPSQFRFPYFAVFLSDLSSEENYQEKNKLGLDNFIDSSIKNTDSSTKTTQQTHLLHTLQSTVGTPVRAHRTPWVAIFCRRTRRAIALYFREYRNFEVHDFLDVAEHQAVSRFDAAALNSNNHERSEDEALLGQDYSSARVDLKRLALANLRAAIPEYDGDNRDVGNSTSSDEYKFRDVGNSRSSDEMSECSERVQKISLENRKNTNFWDPSSQTCGRNLHELIFKADYLYFRTYNSYEEEMGLSDRSKLMVLDSEKMQQTHGKKLRHREATKNSEMLRKYANRAKYYFFQDTRAQRNTERFAFLPSDGEKRKYNVTTCTNSKNKHFCAAFKDFFLRECRDDLVAAELRRSKPTFALIPRKYEWECSKIDDLSGGGASAGGYGDLDADEGRKAESVSKAGLGTSFKKSASVTKSPKGKMKSSKDPSNTEIPSSNFHLDKEKMNLWCSNRIPVEKEPEKMSSAAVQAYNARQKIYDAEKIGESGAASESLSEVDLEVDGAFSDDSTSKKHKYVGGQLPYTTEQLLKMLGSIKYFEKNVLNEPENNDSDFAPAPNVQAACTDSLPSNWTRSCDRYFHWAKGKYFGNSDGKLKLHRSHLYEKQWLIQEGLMKKEIDTFDWSTSSDDDYMENQGRMTRRQKREAATYRAKKKSSACVIS